MISFEILQIAGLLSLVIILIAPFYMVWRKKVKITGRILMSLIIIFFIVDLMVVIDYMISKSYRRTSYQSCISNLNEALNSNCDEQVLQTTLSDWLEDKNGTVWELSESLSGLKSDIFSSDSNFFGDKIKYPADEREPYARPVPRQLPPKGTEVDYSKIPGYTARVKMEEKKNKAYWQGKSIIISGKISLSDGTPLKDVAAHTSFLPDWVFAKCVYPGKSLNFVKTGYEPIYIYIDPKKHYPGNQLDMGHLVMRKLPPEQLRQISFTVEGPEFTDVRLLTGWIPGVFQDDGHECAAHVQVCVENRRIKRGKEVTFTGLSPVAYKIILSAPGYVEKTKYFSGKKRNVNFGTITLVPSRKVVFKQRQFASPNAPWEETILEINGKTRLVVAPRDKYANNVALSLKPDINSDKILADFSWGIPEWYDYGVISPEKLNGELPTPKKSQRDKFLRTGHLYRFVSDMANVDKFIYLQALPSRESH